ncbi:phosphatase PAP2 family protein [Thalassomonas viridans]|uniref:Phosphatase PAP2 family protein n=1 Tax=Thalassomonas viridans TaxID=137584 RepID=A0AAE9Z6G8_9GAMM|nr:phosphatase PAP2 family protein [Thalassomonas viridans]WDE06158.1 phosphatase PAP2 family protein [Thalassomonas viridans]
MTEKFLNRQLALSLCFLLTVFLLFEVTDLDIRLQNLFFNFDTGSWLWPKKEPVLRAVFYSVPKLLLILFALLLILALLLPDSSSRLGKYNSGFFIVLTSLMLIPSVVGGLKATSNSACPAALSMYGGKLPYIKMLEPYPEGQAPAKAQKCFPAGHASGGFALLSLFFLFSSGRNRKLALGLALSVGWFTGGYKMVIGDHFLSHTLITMGLAWFLSCAIARLVYIFKRNLL